MSELATYKVVLTAHITTHSFTPGEKDDPGLWDMSGLMVAIEDSTHCEVTECTELMDVYREQEHITEIEKEVTDLKMERYKLKHLHEGQVKIIQDLRDRLKQKENDNDNV